MSTQTQDHYSDTPVFGVELGVDARGTRVCVQDVAPFTTRKQAEDFAQAHRGAVASCVKGEAEALGKDACDMDGEDGDMDLPIAGATVYEYSDRYGTSESNDLY